MRSHQLAAGIAALVFVMAACGSEETSKPPTTLTPAVNPGPSVTTAEPNTTVEPPTTSEEPPEEFGAVAVWFVDPGQAPTAESTSFTALVNRVECSGGFTGAVSPPEIELTPGEIIVSFTVERLAEGQYYTCPGNEQVPVLVELGEAIGVRPLKDGACLNESPIADIGPCQPPIRWQG